MPLFLILAGLTLIVASVQNTQGTLFTLVKGEFTGSPSYTSWIIAFVLVGIIGYIPVAKKFSVALLALILVAIFLRKGTGFFAQLTAATSGSASTPVTPASTSTPVTQGLVP